LPRSTYNVVFVYVFYYICSAILSLCFNRREVITTSGIRPPSWNFWVKEALGDVGIYTSEKLAPQNKV